MVVCLYFDEVIALLEIRRKVESEGHDTVFALAYVMAVEPHIGQLARTLKLNEDALARCLGRQTELLAIPHHGGLHVIRAQAKGIILIPGMRKGNGLARFVYYPIRIEVVSLPCRSRINTQKHGDSDECSSAYFRGSQGKKSCS